MASPVETAAEPRAPALALRLLLALAGVKFLLHLALSTRYGYFRDELYYLDCARHLDWGYVDHAPLVSWTARLALLLGGSLPSLRVFPALAGAARLLLTGAIAWRLGGGRYAQGMAALATLVAPAYLAVDSTLTLNSFETLIWTAAVYVWIRILQAARPRRWLLLGAALGVGLLNKHSTVFFAAALAAGLLLTPRRRDLLARGPWLAALTASALVLPHAVWQVRHDFPTLAYLLSVRSRNLNVVGPVEFLQQQAANMHPLLFPLWVAGVVWLFRTEKGRYRTLGWAFVLFFGAMYALQVKRHYLLPIYPMALAAGSVALERGLFRWRPAAARRWPRPALAGTVVVAGVGLAPVVLPLLPPDQVFRYEQLIGTWPPRREVRIGPLRQVFSDQFGWPELVEKVAGVYWSLPARERAGATLFAVNFGEAGAINHLGRRHGLPRAVSTDLNYLLWGPGDSAGDPLILVGWKDVQGLQSHCGSVEAAAEHFHPWGMAMENGPILVCRGLRLSLGEFWRQVKSWR